MRIAFLADPVSGNGFYRGIGPMQALAEHGGHRVRALPIEDGARFPPGVLGEIDVLYIHRFRNPRASQLARDAKARGVALVWDDDDHLAAIPKGVYNHKLWTGFEGQRRLAAMRRLVTSVDLVTTPSSHLGELLGREGAARVQVIPNFVPDAWLKPQRIPHQGLTIGWSAGLEHQADAERIPIAGALQRLLDERPDVTVVTFGVKLPLRGERYAHVPLVPLEALTAQLAVLDIGIAPLADIEFNRARSDLKLKEYAAAGVPWLASPIGPYVGLGEKQGGRLVADDRWHEELARLIDKPRDRRKLAKRGAAWVANQTLSRNVGAWEDALTTAVGRARATSSG
jgi:glycosyltransferase involved in cell wall biosynthesis